MGDSLACFPAGLKCGRKLLRVGSESGAVCDDMGV